MGLSYLQGSEEERLAEACERLKAKHGFFILQIGFGEVLAVVANLQLALRHPGNRGYAARIARQTVDDIIERLEGIEPDCALLRKGDNPHFDVAYPPRNPSPPTAADSARVLAEQDRDIERAQAEARQG